MNTLIRFIKNRSETPYVSRYSQWFTLLIIEEVILPLMLSAIAESYTSEVMPFIVEKQTETTTHVSVN